MKNYFFIIAYFLCITDTLNAMNRKRVIDYIDPIEQIKISASGKKQLVSIDYTETNKRIKLSGKIPPLSIWSSNELQIYKDHLEKHPLAKKYSTISLQLGSMIMDENDKHVLYLDFIEIHKQIVDDAKKTAHEEINKLS